MKRDVIIDGYNLLHAAGMARVSYGPGDLERCRLRLLNMLVHAFDDDERSRVTVVFDSNAPPVGSSSVQAHQQMRVLFAEKGEEADDVIEELIARHSHPRQLVVVSSDRRIRTAAKRRRADPWDSESFFDDCLRRSLKRRPETAPAPEKPEENLSPAELAQWLAAFSDVNPQQMRQERAERSIGDSSTAIVGTDTATSPATPEPPKPVSDEDTPEPVAADELAFWEERIARILDAERGPRDRRP